MRHKFTQHFPACLNEMSPVLQADLVFEVSLLSYQTPIIYMLDLLQIHKSSYKLLWQLVLSPISWDWNKLLRLLQMLPESEKNQKTTTNQSTKFQQIQQMFGNFTNQVSTLVYRFFIWNLFTEKNILSDGTDMIFFIYVYYYERFINVSTKHFQIPV